ncbi:uncharacterized protein LOC128235205 isoform X2 [Mya arenaria]|uniref:uncharacterized protein LOC128235205 isoform X2 n=1 Tax=Mya arenaria TaxID=6604 RepID=UPI0022E2CA25|nr:uncharacterized protein LOC128235205 isoform X2 [Mya arenaria]
MCMCMWIVTAIPALFGHVYAASNQYGSISVEGPAFVNREVTLKATPHYPWGCDVEWRYLMEKGKAFRTIKGTNISRYLEKGSFFLKLTPSIEYNNSVFFARCSTNTTIKTRMISLNMKDIVGQCGALMLLSPVVRGADVILGYFPSDDSIKRQTFTRRTWQKNKQDIQLREGFYEEKISSVYLFTLTIFNFDEGDEGTYNLECNSVDNTESVQLHFLEQPSYPVLGPKSNDFNTTQCIYVYGGSDMYCITDNGTKPVQVILSLGQDSFVFGETEINNGLYRFRYANQQMAGLSRQNVTCQVSYAVLETSYEVHGILCNVEQGSPPILTVPEFLDGENSTASCAVRNAIPAPAIEMHIGTVLLDDVLQTDSFQGSSYTFTSSARVTKANIAWNGKEMCCTRKSKYEFGFNDISVCKNISMKFPPSNISLTINKIPKYNNTYFISVLNISCETNESNPPCTIEWSSDNSNLRYIQSNNWTNGDNGRYSAVSNVLYSVSKYMAGGTITCSIRCDHFQSHLTTNYTVSSSGGPTLYLNMTSPVQLCPNTRVTVNCLVDDSNANGQWTLRWEDANTTVLRICTQIEECLLTLDYTGDGLNTYICYAWTSVDLLKHSLTVSSSMTEDLFMEATIVKQSIPNILNLTCNTSGKCMPCAIAWSSNSVLLDPISTSQWTKNSGSGYTSVSNALYFITKDVDGKRIQCSVNCGNESSYSNNETYTISFQAVQVYATLLRRRKTAVRERCTHVYDTVSNVETTALHNLRGVSTNAIQVTNAPQHLDMEGNKVLSNENVSHYDYVDTTSDHSDSQTNAPDANYIHAL